VAQPLSPTQSLKLYVPNPCEDNEGVHTQRVGCNAAFIVLDFDLGLAREPTARAMYQGQCPMSISLSIGKRDGEHALRRLIGGIAKQDATFSPRCVPRWAKVEALGNVGRLLLMATAKEMEQGPVLNPPADESS